MATLKAENPRLVAGPVMETVSKLILNGQSWKAGQLLYDNTSGLLRACATDADAATGGIKYVALDDQTDPGNSTTYAEVGIINRKHEFEANELDGQVTAGTIGYHAGVDVTDNILTIDVDDTTNPAVEVTDVGFIYNPGRYDATDTLAKLKFRILTTVLEAARA